ncbi:hypothetical protein Hbl1158_10860 [Halobaculum sp. CBA1158]|uniref:hypothetical protein n=1 Tax=Halobaculum sp. CBA1158 TaxID=2904243 RepID=UPI001F1F7318|nr:hypothetical protein [Halobaculum sp. CBA1158]UIO99032.1 hypothetical protein Hbl1158_10860 [Halobaculum sp. CBA1158]
MAGVATGLVLGSLVGAVATAAGSYFVFRRRRRAETDHLRLAFRTELEALSYVADLAEEGRYEALAASVEPPQVYENNADRVGHLTDDEVEALVAFYTDLYWLRDQQDVEDKKDRVDEVAKKWHEAVEAVRAAS